MQEEEKNLTTDNVITLSLKFHGKYCSIKVSQFAEENVKLGEKNLKLVSYSSRPLHPKLKSPLGVNFLQILFPAGPNIHRGISQNPLHQLYLVKFVYVLH